MQFTLIKLIRVALLTLIACSPNPVGALTPFTAADQQRLKDIDAQLKQYTAIYGAMGVQAYGKALLDEKETLLAKQAATAAPAAAPVKPSKPTRRRFLKNLLRPGKKAVGALFRAGVKAGRWTLKNLLVRPVTAGGREVARYLGKRVWGRLQVDARQKRLDKAGVTTLYHATNRAAADKILASQIFLLGEKGAVGPGIYFADNVAACRYKSAQGSDVILAVQVKLGKPLVVSARDAWTGDINADYVLGHKNGYDSVRLEGFRVPYGCGGRGNEYVVYNTEQVVGISDLLV